MTEIINILIEGIADFVAKLNFGYLLTFVFSTYVLNEYVIVNYLEKTKFLSKQLITLLWGIILGVLYAYFIEDFIRIKMAWIFITMFFTMSIYKAIGLNVLMGKLVNIIFGNR